MRALLAILTSAALVAVASGCTGGDTSTSDPRELAQRALAAMNDLDSYRVNLDFRSPQIGPLLVEFARPQSYRLQGGFKQQSPGGEPVERVIESIFIGEDSYHRQCESAAVGCGEWQQGQRSAAAPPGPSPLYLPQWPLAGLDLADGLKLAGREDLNGESMLKLTGTVNHIRAVLENQRRLYTAAGVTSFGELCEGGAETPGPGTPAAGEQSCHELTYEEAANQQEPALSFYDDHPGAIDVWVSAEDFLVHRVEVTVPPFNDASLGGDPSAVQTSVISDYSMFNQVTIKAPQ